MPPSITRRDFLQAASLLAAPGALAHAAEAPDVRAAPAAFAYAYVGTYTPNGGGIYLFRLDKASGALTQLQVFDDIRNPSWLVTNPAQTRLYAVSEITTTKELALAPSSHTPLTARPCSSSDWVP